MFSARYWIFKKKLFVLWRCDVLYFESPGSISYLITYRTGRKEGNVLFNDALKTFYFMVIWRRTCGNGPLRYGEETRCRHMGYSFRFYMHHPTDRIAHTTAFGTPVVEHWLEREIAQWYLRKIRLFAFDLLLFLHNILFLKITELLFSARDWKKIFDISIMEVWCIIFWVTWQYPPSNYT